MDLGKCQGYMWPGICVLVGFSSLWMAYVVLQPFPPPRISRRDCCKGDTILLKKERTSQRLNVAATTVSRDIQRTLKRTPAYISGTDVSGFESLAETTFQRSDIPDHIRRYEETFRSVFPNFNASAKSFLYKCTDLCGGLGDRIKGIMTMFLISVLSKRKFGIILTRPCRLENFYEPNLLNWKKDDKELIDKEYKFIDHKAKHVADQQSFNKKDINFENYYGNDKVLVMASRDWSGTLMRHTRSHDVFPELYSMSYSDIIRVVFRGLFKPTPKITRRVETFFEEKVQEKKLACVHARMGDDWERYKLDDFRPIWDFLRKFNQSGEFKIFVSADKQEVRVKARNIFGDNVIEPGGPLTHMDMSVDKDDACDGFGTALIENDVLTKCDVLILTYSGFGIQAAHLRHTSKDLYCYFRTHGVFPCRRELLKYLYGWECASDVLCY